MRAPHSTIGLLVALASACCGTGIAPACAEEINLYSTREAPLVEPVIAAFTAATAIKVNLTVIPDNLVNRMKAEGDASPADVLMTIGLEKTAQFAANNLTQPLVSPVMQNAMPANLRGRDGQWLALSVRPRVVMVGKASSPATITYEDLADPRWRGRFCIRSLLHQNNVALVSAFLLHHGAEATEAWLRGLKANLAHPPAGKDNDVIREIAQGTCDIGIANTVALAQLLDGREGADWKEWAGKVQALPTTFENGGAHVNLTGAALARNAPHKEAAIRFLEFLLTAAAQKIYAAAELEYPVIAGAEPHSIVAGIGTFTADPLTIDRIAANQKAAIALIKKADLGG